MKSRKLYSFLLPFLTVPILVGFYLSDDKVKSNETINGVCFVAPRHEVSTEHIDPIVKINANWVAVTPYAFSQAGKPQINFNHNRQWWGERVDGAIQTVIAAKKLGLKIMMKPHIWVRGQGWAGEFDLDNEADWKKWESDYTKYILTYAHISDSLNVELLCIGTEYKIAVQKRPEYWKQLIKEVRAIYKGQLTYAANWDNFHNVTFWPHLDFIGVDAYFPICKEKTPKVFVLKQNWKKVKSELKDFSDEYAKPILFTEYGYRSMDYTAGGHWEMDRQEGVLNMEGQKNALEALFDTYWNEPWFAGGFLWKWHAKHSENGGENNSRYTPQNKPAEQVVKLWYGKNQGKGKNTL